jgi:hypothetical protein
MGVEGAIKYCFKKIVTIFLRFETSQSWLSEKYTWIKNETKTLGNQIQLFLFIKTLVDWFQNNIK